MKKRISGLFVAATLSFCGTTLAATEEMKKEQPVAETTAAEKPMAQEGKEKNQPGGVKLEAGRSRQSDRDLRHCLDLKDNAAIAKCAGE